MLNIAGQIERKLHLSLAYQKAFADQYGVDEFTE